MKDHHHRQRFSVLPLADNQQVAAAVVVAVAVTTLYLITTPHPPHFGPLLPAKVYHCVWKKLWSTPLLLQTASVLQVTRVVRRWNCSWMITTAVMLWVSNKHIVLTRAVVYSTLIIFNSLEGSTLSSGNSQGVVCLIVVVTGGGSD